MLIGVPLAGVLCLGLAVAGAAYGLSRLRGTPTLPAPTATQAQVVVLSSTPPAAATIAPTVGPTAALVATATSTAMPQPTAPTVGMLPVEGGTFLMGFDAGQADERPPHDVAVSAFFMDQYEVTNSRYLQCVAAGACTPPSQNGSATRAAYFDDPQFANFPVVNVNWSQAQQFCQWDGGKRLPTEAEWEFAATGGDGRRFPWGNAFDLKRVPALEKDTVAVGSLPNNASPVKAMDMAGNVIEWVADFYASNYYSQAPSENPPGPASGNSHVARGGSFDNPEAVFYTTTRRYHFATNQSEVDIGFRCALTAP